MCSAAGFISPSLSFNTREVAERSKPHISSWPKWGHTGMEDSDQKTDVLATEVVN